MSVFIWFITNFIQAVLWLPQLPGVLRFFSLRQYGVVPQEVLSSVTKY